MSDPELTAPNLKWLWGQILKDAGNYDASDATFAHQSLVILGYTTTDLTFMGREYQTIIEAMASDAIRPDHWFASMPSGHSIYRCTDELVGRRFASADAGRGNLETFRPATNAEVDWFEAMGGVITTVRTANEVHNTHGAI